MGRLCNKGHSCMQVGTASWEKQEMDSLQNPLKEVLLTPQPDPTEADFSQVPGDLLHQQQETNTPTKQGKQAKGLLSH